MSHLPVEGRAKLTAELAALEEGAALVEEAAPEVLEQGVAPPAKIRTDVLQQMDNLVIHPWEDIGEVGENKRLMLRSGEGIYVVDNDGRRFIDAPGGMWAVNVGHGRGEIADAMAEQARALAYYSPWSGGAPAPTMLAAKLASYAPGDLNRVFFTTGGSTAVDGALRFVFFYNNALGRPKKKKIIARVGGYHGSTYLTASCSGKMFEKLNMDMAPGIRLLPIPKPLLRPKGMSIEEFCDEKVADLENAILEEGPDTVAAFLAEPILASGGVVIPPPGYHKRCLEVCRKYDVLYISDEVVTAFGRLGAMFASEDVFGIVPDIITTAKGLTSGYVPMGAMIISDRLIADIQASGANSKYFFSGFTYSGHPVSAAAALKNLEIMEREEILAHANRVAPRFAERLLALEKYPVVSETRVKGLMAGIECTLDKDDPDETRDIEFASRIDKYCFEHGLLVRPVYNMCVMSPPLIITDEEIDQMADILDAGIRSAMSEAGVSH